MKVHQSFTPLPNLPQCALDLTPFLGCDKKRKQDRKSIPIKKYSVILIYCPFRDRVQTGTHEKQNKGRYIIHIQTKRIQILKVVTSRALPTKSKSKFHRNSPCEHDRKQKEITNQKGRKMLLNLERISTCKFLNRSMSSALSMTESPRCRYCLCFARMWSRTDSSSGSRVALYS